MIYPWQKLIINAEKLKRIRTNSIADDVKIEPGVHISGKVKIGAGAVLKSGTYIEGPVEIGKNCTLGPNCYLRPNTLLEDKVRIGASVEVKNVIVGKGSIIKHLSYVSDSVIGTNSNVGAGTIVANLRHDSRNIRVNWRGKLLDSETKKFGCYVGNYCKLGISNVIYPGTIIDDHVLTLPGQIIDHNLKSFTFGGKPLSKDKIKLFWPERKVASSK